MPSDGNTTKATNANTSGRIAVHAAGRIHYTESRTFCFTNEIATLLTASSLQFAVAVGRNHTVKTPGTTNRTLCRPSGPTPTMQRMKLQAFG